MDLLEQCRIWNENDEYQKIIDAIEAIPESELTPELASELARAYNNAADVEAVSYTHLSETEATACILHFPDRQSFWPRCFCWGHG